MQELSSLTFQYGSESTDSLPIASSTTAPTTSSASETRNSLAEREGDCAKEGGLLEAAMVLLLRLVYHKPVLPTAPGSSKDKELKAVVHMATGQWENLLEVRLPYQFILGLPYIHCMFSIMDLSISQRVFITPITAVARNDALIQCVLLVFMRGRYWWQSLGPFCPGPSLAPMPTPESSRWGLRR